MLALSQRRKNKYKNYTTVPPPLPHPKIKHLSAQHFNIQLEHEQHKISDAEGLRRAYEAADRLYRHGHQLFVAGTTWTDDKMNVSKPPWYTVLLKGIFPQTIPDNFSLKDAIDDLKIPEYKTRDIQRYKDANKVIEKNPDITELIGHSMGGSVVLQLNNDYNNKFETRTYAAPVFDPISHPSQNNVERYRTFGDIVAGFDNNAQTTFKNTINPLELHSYNNFQNK